MFEDISFCLTEKVYNAGSHQNNVTIYIYNLYIIYVLCINWKHSQVKKIKRWDVVLMYSLQKLRAAFINSQSLSESLKSFMCVYVCVHFTGGWCVIMCVQVHPCECQSKMVGFLLHHSLLYSIKTRPFFIRPKANKIS